MRKYVIVMIGMCLSHNVFSQTTIEEYNYITKGYKIQLESGLDMKKGYEFVDIGVSDSGIRKAELKALYRTNNKTIAAYMIIYMTKGYKEYICIPHPASSMTGHANARPAVLHRPDRQECRPARRAGGRNLPSTWHL